MAQDERVRKGGRINLKNLVQTNVGRAFQIASEFTPLATFQLQIVWNINPINDTEARTPLYTKTVPIIRWKNVITRNEEGYLVFREQVCVQQWTDLPALTDNDLMVDPDGITRQIETVEPEPSNSIWLVTLRGPTSQT